MPAHIPTFFNATWLRAMKHAWLVLALIVPALTGCPPDSSSGSGGQGAADTTLAPLALLMRHAEADAASLAPETSAISPFTREGSATLGESFRNAADVTSGRTVLLNLFEDASFTGVIRSVERPDSTTCVITGELRGTPGTFVIVSNSSTTVANVHAFETGDFQVRPTAGGSYIVRESNPEAEKAASDDVARPAEVAHPPLHPAQEDGSEIDVLVVYTPAAARNAGGQAAMEAAIRLYVAETNEAYRMSQVTPRLRLVGMREMAYTETDVPSTELGRLMGKEDGHMDDVHTLRDQTRADLIALILEYSRSGGLANGMDETNDEPSFEAQAFSTIDRESADSYFSFAHELGHNMGCDHNLADATGNGGVHDYSYGWRFTVQGQRYITIMAYRHPDGSGRKIQYFSNPNVAYLGVATGVPAGSTNEAHCARTLNETARLVANFRQRNPA